jgi:hypothetical protein
MNACTKPQLQVKVKTVCWAACPISSRAKKILCPRKPGPLGPDFYFIAVCGKYPAGMSKNVKGGFSASKNHL